MSCVAVFMANYGRYFSSPRHSIYCSRLHYNIILLQTACSMFGSSCIGSDYSNISEGVPSIPDMTSPYNISRRLTDSSNH